MNTGSVDVAILGGGIAGLWALDRLRAAGYAAVLLEKDKLGAGQTIAAQGIIHSGLKYNIPGFEDRPLASLAEMPARWRQSLDGTVGPDLTAARVLSPRFMIHARAGVLSRAVGGMAQALSHSDVAALPETDWPAAFAGADGAIYTIDEFVVDVPSVLQALARPHADVIRRLPDGTAPQFQYGVLRAGDFAMAARCCVLAAGAGNEGLLAGMELDDVACQRRPLHQVMAAGLPSPVFAHCIGASVKPLATITSHGSPDGSYVWYVGGGIAEDGVMQSEAEVIARARKDLAAYVPGADLSAARWRALRVDRADFGGENGERPGDAVVVARGDLLVAWPTKMALAPHLADRIVDTVRTQLGEPRPADLEAFSRLPRPEIAQPPWADAAAWT